MHACPRSRNGSDEAVSESRRILSQFSATYVPGTVPDADADATIAEPMAHAHHVEKRKQDIFPLNTRQMISPEGKIIISMYATAP